MLGAFLLPLCVPASPHVESVGAFVSRIASDLGRTVEVERDLRSVPLLVDAGERTPNLRLQDLAFALHASIVRDGKGLRVERTPEDRQKIEAIHRTVLVQTIATGLQQYDRLLKQSAKLGDEEAQIRAAQLAIDRTVQNIQTAEAAGRSFPLPRDLVFPGLLTPVGRLNLDLMVRLGPEKLSDLGSEGVRFYSDRPNAVESILPKCDDLLVALRRRGTTGSSSAERYSKLILRVDKNGAALSFFGATGRSLGSSYLSYANRIIIHGSDLPAPQENSPRWLSLDPRSRQMASFFTISPNSIVAGLMRGDEARSTLLSLPLQNFPKAFLQPEKEDPLDFAVRDAVLSLPRATKSPGLMAVLSDDLLGLANGLVRDGRLDFSSFETAVLLGFSAKGTRFERISHAGMNFFRPIDLYASERGLVDRAVLGKALRRIIADRRVSFQNWSSIHYDLYRAVDSDVKQRYVSALMYLGLRIPRDIVAIDPRVLALVGAALATNRPRIDANLPPFSGLLRDAITQDWLRFQGVDSTSDLDLTPSSLLASLALRRAWIDLLSSEMPVIDRYSGSKAGFVGSELDRWGIDPLYPAPTISRTVSRTQTLFDQEFLQPRYRSGRRISLTAELRLGQGPFTRIKMEDSVLERDDLTFGQLPPAFRQRIVEGVVNGLRNEGTSVPDFLLDPRLTRP